jgi:HlyD family secretion protein
MDIQRTDLKKQAQRRRAALIAGAVIAVVALGAFVSTLDPAAPSVASASLWTDTVKRGEMLREVRGPGTLVPKEIRWIAAETAARVERIAVKPGALVEADTVILELSNPELIDAKLAAEREIWDGLSDLVGGTLVASFCAAVRDQGPSHSALRG